MMMYTKSVSLRVIIRLDGNDDGDDDLIHFECPSMAQTSDGQEADDSVLLTGRNSL